MKITKIDTFLVSAVWRNFVIVRLETDEGVVGGMVREPWVTSRRRLLPPSMISLHFL